MNSRAFSLIEVVISLGIIVFALVALIALFSLGLKTNKESSDQIQAADLASLLVATRRGMPTNTITNFALPSLNRATNNTVTVGVDGLTISAAASLGTESYKLEYQITPGTLVTNVANVYLLLWWPAALAAAPSNNPGGYYELNTQVVLP